MADMKNFYDVLPIINLYIVSLTENDLIFKAILTLVLDFMYILKTPSRTEQCFNKTANYKDSY